MTNPFPFTGGNILNATDLNAIGEVESYTPSFAAGVTVGDGTLLGQYVRINDLVVSWAYFQLGSTSAITGDVSVSVPVSITSGGGVELAAGTECYFIDLSTGIRWLGMARDSSGDNVFLRYARQSTAAAAANFANNISSTLPFTWATSDFIVWHHTYRVNT